MNLAINNINFHKLANTVLNSICKSFCHLNISEPQLVANLVWELPRAINALSFSGGLDIKSSGVFVHGQPRVKCKNFPDKKPTSIEIGDLLLIRKEVSNGTVKDTRALLLQAKKSSHLIRKPDHKNQHYLYANWPPFQYVNSTLALNKKRRHITGKKLYKASRYLLIVTNQSYCPACFIRRNCVSNSYHNCTLTASAKKTYLDDYQCFVDELICFLLGKAGRMFKKPRHPSNINWDRVIEDLTTVTAGRKSIVMKRFAGDGKRKRGQGVLCFLSGNQQISNGFLYLGEDSTRSSISTDGDPPRVPDNWPDGNDNNGGISIIEFIIETDS